MKQIALLAKEYDVHHATVNRWINEDPTIEKFKKGPYVFVSDEDADKIKEMVNKKKDRKSANPSGSNFAKKDINYNWRRGLPTRISY